MRSKKVLEQLGHSTEAFDQRFLELYGSIKSVDLRRAKIPCNDLVGTATRLVEEMI